MGRSAFLPVMTTQATRPLDALGHAAMDRRRVSAFAALALGDDADRCEAAAWRLLDETGDLQALAHGLFAPAARLIGERWCADRVSFITVTLAVSRLHRLFRSMAARLPPVPGHHHGGVILLAPVPGEQHGFGLSVVDDAFQRAGWHVDACTDDDPAALFRQTGAVRYDVVGLSIGAERLLPALASTIGRLRSVSSNRSVVIAVGGSLVAAMPGAIVAAGADIVATDLPSAMTLCRRTVETPGEIGHRSVAAE